MDNSASEQNYQAMKNFWSSMSAQQMNQWNYEIDCLRKEHHEDAVLEAVIKCGLCKLDEYASRYQSEVNKC